MTDERWRGEACGYCAAGIISALIFHSADTTVGVPLTVIGSS